MQFERLYGDVRECLTILSSFTDEGLTPYEIAHKFNLIDNGKQKYAMCMARLSKDGYIYYEWDVGTDKKGVNEQRKFMIYNVIRMSQKARQYLEWEKDEISKERQKMLQVEGVSSMFYKLPSNTHQLLKDILKADNPVEMLQNRFEIISDKEDDELRGMLRELQENGFMDIFWADDVPYTLFLSNLARTYEEQLADYVQQQSSASKIEYNIHAQQANVATDKAIINATQYNDLDVSKLNALIEKVKQCIPPELSSEEKETVEDSLDTIEAITSSTPPKKGIIRTALTALKITKETTEFAAAVMALSDFINQFL